MIEKELLFVPLGGAGEIGMNLSLYGYGDDWVMIDCGVTFSDDRHPGVEVFVPDITFVNQEIENLHGIIITHAHEDHIGGVPHLWRYLKCPVYATPFAAGHLRRKLSEAGLAAKVPLNEVDPGGKSKVGPFSFNFIPLAHSVPETQAVALKTPAGTVLHITDWKIDPAPIVGSTTDQLRLKSIGDNGVISMMCDSTNIQVSGHSGSEGVLSDTLVELISACEKRVIVACFASNIARLVTCFKAAEAAGRSVGLVGRSLWTMTENARKCGYLDDIPEFLSPEEIGFLPRDKVLILATGSQGEPRAALSRIAADSHNDIVLERDDTVIFSSKEIPGNERAIGRVQNQLSRLGVNIITEKDEFVHVSGHPARDEVAQLYRWVKPPIVVPIHGETRHLTEHIKFATEQGIPESLVVQNGSVLKLSPGPAEIIDEVPHGRYAVDGKNLIAVDSEVLKTRRRMTYGGLVAVTIVLDGEGYLVVDPEISFHGVLEGQGKLASEILEELVEDVSDGINSLRQKNRKNNDNVKELTSRLIRRVLRQECGLRPVVQLHVIRT